MMMMSDQITRRIGFLTILAAVAVTTVLALGTGQSFLVLDPLYEQELYGVADLGADPDDDTVARTVLGGVAFAPDGDVWSSECSFGFNGTVLHRFDSQTNSPILNGTSTLHPRTMVDTEGGCGLVNHPDGVHMYSNSAVGVFQLDAETAAVTATFPATEAKRGNALGIAVDPRPGHHIVYAGAACHPTLPDLLEFLDLPFEPECKIYDLDPSTGDVTDFATLNVVPDPAPFVDGIYFDPTGTYLFVAKRDPAAADHELMILRRPEDSVPNTVDPQLAQSVPLTTEPDGVAFHAAAPKFVVTNDEEGGTMTMFTFPGTDGDNYTAPPVVTTFASGGFRGDLLQVGVDGCIYATQGRDFLAADFGTRYDNGTTTSEDSIVRICAEGGGGFEPPPGVTETVQPPVGGQCTGVIGDFVWVDLNRDGLQGAGEPGLGSVPVALKDLSGGVLATTFTSVSGIYQFADLCAGSYLVEVTPPAGYDQTVVGAGADPALDSNSSPATVVLPTDNAADLTIDFGMVSGFCEKGPVQETLNPNGTHFPGNQGPDRIVRAQFGQFVQEAVDQAADVNGDGYIIVGVIGNDGGVLGGHVTQQVVVSRAYPQPFALIGCSVTLHDPTPGDGAPTARVLASASAPPDGIGARIFVMDVHAEGSDVAGWLVEGNNRYLRNTYALDNAVGIRFVGSSNTMHNGKVEGNQGVGLRVEGNSNTVTDTDVFSNGGHGVSVTGNANQILKVDAGDKNKGNGGDGVHVAGAGNLLSEIDAFANGGDGIEVVAAAGSANIVKKARSGDKSGKGNAGNGILVSGVGNGAANPIELEENTVKANGLAGIRVLGSAHQLKKNIVGGTSSGEPNVGCEFLAVTGNANATGNKANGVTVPGANGSAFPTTCIGS